MKAILVGKPSIPYLDALTGKINTDWNFVCLEDVVNGERAKDEVQEADAIISIVYQSNFPSAPKLRLLQAPGTGLDRIDFASVPPSAAICNAYGHQIPIAEYCVLAMLVCAHQLVQINREFKAGNWIWTNCDKFPTHNEVFDKVVCVVGLGRIGQEVAKRAKALGMHVMGCSRSAGKVVQGVDETGTYSDLEAFIGKCDFLILACPLSDETQGIINGRLLNMMKRTGVLINVGRGPLAEEEDLFIALKGKTIAAAVLDVWYQYPDDADPHRRPSRYAFQELDNVIMTPHLSGWTDEMVDRRWAEIATNLDNLVLGKPLINLVRSGS